jgi:hypothetical protein
MVQTTQHKPPRFSTVDTLGSAGIVSMVAGVSGYNVFAGLIVLGLLLLAVAYGLAKKPATEKEGA